MVKQLAILHSYSLQHTELIELGKLDYYQLIKEISDSVGVPLLSEFFLKTIYNFLTLLKSTDDFSVTSNLPLSKKTKPKSNKRRKKLIKLIKIYCGRSLMNVQSHHFLKTIIMW